MDISQAKKEVVFFKDRGELFDFLIRRKRAGSNIWVEMYRERFYSAKAHFYIERFVEGRWGGHENWGKRLISLLTDEELAEAHIHNGRKRLIEELNGYGYNYIESEQECKNMFKGLGIGTATGGVIGALTGKGPCAIVAGATVGATVGMIVGVIHGKKLGKLEREKFIKGELEKYDHENGLAVPVTPPLLIEGPKVGIDYLMIDTAIHEKSP